MTSKASKRATPFVAETVKKDFPILQQEVNGQPLVYLDSAASTQKPNAVIDAISNYYRTTHSNVHRGAHTLSERATEAFEQARQCVADFLGCSDAAEVLWTRGTTESVNLVAHSWGRHFLQAGDKILVSTLEHHSNIVPWQLIAELTGAQLVPVPLDEHRDIDLEAMQALLDNNVKLIAVAHVSNALGNVNPIDKIVELAKSVGALTFVDGAQALAHYPVDVNAMGCDFYAFSGHKLFGPTGIGVLWGRRELLEAMPPFLAGGEMIETVSFAGTTFNELPFKFEAGTPDIAGAIGLAAAIEYLQQFDRREIVAHEAALLTSVYEKAEAFVGINSWSKIRNSAGIFSFNLEGTHPADVGTLLDQQGIAVRTGHHCTQPLMAYLNVPGTVRASFSIYNTLHDVDRLFAALEKAKLFLL
ncbi:MAG: SufS family cysteine desulfurase [Cellvibrionaceae bacterium]|nr:SufS family cysteine desulfurase [Cellvibrionaceae bacterium]